MNVLPCSHLGLQCPKCLDSPKWCGSCTQNCCSHPARSRLELGKKRWRKRLDCGTKESENVNFAGEGRSVFVMVSQLLTAYREKERRGSFLPRQ